MIEANTFLYRFLGIGRVEELRTAWSSRILNSPNSSLSALAVIFAVGVALFPSIGSVLEFFYQMKLTTTLIGVAACFAIVFRVNSKIPFLSVSDWKRSLRLTHTAFALGCIPVLVILIVYPDAFSHVHSSVASTSGDGVVGQTKGDMVLFVLRVAVWAAVTEEFIFRGMVISAIRRWDGLGSQRRRDIFAVVVSAILFGLSHGFAWGPAMSIALTGLGLGFGVAYIVIGELLLPLIVYHAVFDILSLSVALWFYT